MRHEKILIRQDKTKYKIMVDSYDCQGKINYRFTVLECLPKKRTWVKKSHGTATCLEYVTKEELSECATELWRKQKPDFNMLGLD